MAKTTKPLTTQKVHAAFRQLGFGPSKNTGVSRIRGLPNRSPGYTVRDGGDSIIVSWVGGDHAVPIEVVRENVQTLGDALVGAGYACSLAGLEIVIPKGERN